MTIKEIGQKLSVRQGRKEGVLDNIQGTKKDITVRKETLTYLEEAREIIKLVGIKTQDQLEYHISDITSLALESVFSNPYRLNVNFIERRNKTECDLTFERNEKEIDPLDSAGYGAVDVASFALRVACWSLQSKRMKLRNTIILDEPFRFLSVDYREDASAMLKEVGDKLGIQFIIVTHDSVLSKWADNTIKISKKGKKAIINEI